MWWEEHWVQLVTLVAIAGAWADMRAYIRRVDDREHEHFQLVEKRIDKLEEEIRLHLTRPIRGGR